MLLTKKTNASGCHWLLCRRGLQDTWRTLIIAASNTGGGALRWGVVEDVIIEWGKRWNGKMYKYIEMHLLLLLSIEQCFTSKGYDALAQHSQTNWEVVWYLLIHRSFPRGSANRHRQNCLWVQMGRHTTNPAPCWFWEEFKVSQNLLVIENYAILNFKKNVQTRQMTTLVTQQVLFIGDFFM